MNRIAKTCRWFLTGCGVFSLSRVLPLSLYLLLASIGHGADNPWTIRRR